MEILKFAVTGIICALAVVLVREHRGDISPFVQIAGVTVLALMCISVFIKIFERTKGLLPSSDVIDSGYLDLLIKIVGIAVITKISSDICNDSGNSAISSAVELAGKALILLLCMPLLEAVASLAGGLLE
ncbi:MAG: SpoIIIAC/SpoIIIAD family protein [Clostridia bacterium]|nr:SpoIIIAC/SpoIIIAD family protein [Clostridia bacterium]